MIARRSVFDRNGEYLAVKSFPRAGYDIKPGDKVEARTNLLRHWYKLRRIGLKGDSWTEDRLSGIVKEPAVESKDSSEGEQAPIVSKVFRRKSKAKES